MQKKSNKRSVYIAIAIVLFVGLSLLLGNTHTTQPKNTLTVAVAPLKATITINGKAGINGMNKISPGSVEVVASFKGFASQSQIITVKPGNGNYVGLVLLPNSTATAGWYNTHPADQTASSAITSRLVGINTAAALNSTPIIQILPYLGPGFEYRIDYGVDPSDPSSTTQAIYIDSSTPRGYSDALYWINSQGYDLATLKIVFTNTGSLED